jgi:hypothetical protein
VSQFPFRNAFPRFMYPLLTGWFNPRADGNCGFRVFANALLHTEENWEFVRRSVVTELANHGDRYERVYGGMEYVAEAIERISWEGGPCPRDHWMSAIADLFPIATAFDCAIMMYTLHRGSCATVLPCVSRTAPAQPLREVGITLTADHFIQLQFDGDYPVPVIPGCWDRMRDESLANLRDRYTIRVHDFTRLLNG